MGGEDPRFTGEGLSPGSAGQELVVRLLPPHWTRAAAASKVWRHSLTVEVGVAPGEGRLDVPQVRRGRPASASKLQKFHGLYTVIKNMQSWTSLVAQ